MIIIYNDIQETIILYNLSTTNNNTDNHNNNIDIIMYSCTSKFKLQTTINNNNDNIFLIIYREQ